MDKQVALISRWHRRVVDSGTKLLSLACFDNTKFISKQNAIEDDLLSFSCWDLEFTVEVIDTLHDFCFFLRKVIERSNAIELAKKTYPHREIQSVKINQGGIDETEIELCQKDLWWILGRFIHSESVMVLGGTKNELVVYKDGKSREFIDSRTYIEVSSDYDAKKNKSHIIYIPSLVHCYVFSALSHEVDRVVRGNVL